LLSSPCDSYCHWDSEQRRVANEPNFGLRLKAGPAILSRLIKGIILHKFNRNLRQYLRSVVLDKVTGILNNPMFLQLRTWDGFDPSPLATSGHWVGVTKCSDKRQL
jgi:hypothetical protein